MRRLHVAVLLAGLSAASVVVAETPPRFRCPEVAGQYRIVGEGSALSEAMDALGFGRSGQGSRQLVVTSDASGALNAALRGDEPGHALEFSSQYSCVDGWLVFRVPVQAYRGEHDGESRVRMKRGGEGLAVEIVFTGRRWLTLYSYDSARLRVPLPFTGTTVRTTLEWPVETSPAPRLDARARQDVAAARGLLTSAVLLDVDLTDMAPSGDGVLVHLRARREREVDAFQQRLRAASIKYEMSRAPVWSDQFWYFDILVWPPRK